MTLRKKYENAPAVGVYGICNSYGLAILELDDETAVSAFAGTWGPGWDDIRKTRVHYTSSGRAYIRRYNRRYYFDEIMRAGA